MSILGSSKSTKLHLRIIHPYFSGNEIVLFVIKTLPEDHIPYCNNGSHPSKPPKVRPRLTPSFVEPSRAQSSPHTAHPTPSYNIVISPASYYGWD